MEKRFGKIKEDFFKIINSKKGAIYLAIIILVGLVLVFIGEALCTNTQSESIHNVLVYGVTFGSIVVLCMVMVILFICYKLDIDFQTKRQKKIDEINRISHLKELEDKYSNFIKLVNGVLKEIFGEIDETKVPHEFLVKLEEYEKEYNSVLPQSFTEAVCLFLALIKCPVIVTDNENEDEKKEILGLNVRIALSCAIKMIIHPITFYKNLNGEVCQEYYDKVIMLFPDGNSLDCEEGQKVLNSVFNDIVQNGGTQGFSYYEMLFRKIYMNGRKR